jgi:N-acetylmuramoyl-L-alanine amidase
VKRKIIIFGILSLLLLSPLWADRHGYVRKVVIDPGHGGRDPGAIGAVAKEKDIVLAISLKVGEYIKQNFDDVEVIYTRTTDEFIELHRRAQIANENKADLFISVHCNASRSNRAFGSETFVMGLHRSSDNLEVAKKENASILYEEDYLETYDGYDPNSPESNIIFSMFQNLYLNQSVVMASLVQDQFRDRAGRHDRGVKQAGFLVLYNITMPGILVEAGFLSHAQEEKYLISETGQSHIASAIFRAFRDYKKNQDNLASQQLSGTNGRNSPSAISPTEPTHQASTTATTPVNQSPPVLIEQNPPAQQPRRSEINFRVQFATTTVEKPLNAPEFRGLQNINFYIHDGLYKYTVGKEKTIEEAIRVQQNLQQIGFKDAFVVAFKDNERIPPAEAIRLLRSGD